MARPMDNIEGRFTVEYVPASLIYERVVLFVTQCFVNVLEFYINSTGPTIQKQSCMCGEN